MKKNLFYGVKRRLQSWARLLIENIDDKDLRAHFWMNSPDHLIGNHQYCYHDQFDFCKQDKFWVWKNGSKNLIAFEALCNFVGVTLKYIVACDKDRNTQTNESVNAEMAHYAPKRFSLKSSYRGRIAYAIGMHNSPTFLYDLLIANGLSEMIHPDLLDELRREDIKNYENREIRRSDEYRKKRRIKRNEFRNRYSNKGDYHLDGNSTEYEDYDDSDYSYDYDDYDE